MIWLSVSAANPIDAIQQRANDGVKCDDRRPMAVSYKVGVACLDHAHLELTCRDAVEATRVFLAVNRGRHSQTTSGKITVIIFRFDCRRCVARFYAVRTLGFRQIVIRSDYLDYYYYYLYSVLARYFTRKNWKKIYSSFLSLIFYLKAT